jgi:mannose-1-phosphate guanylyltransferase
VRDSAVGRGAHIEAGVVLDGVVVGDGARICSGNELRNGARIWPDAVLPAGAIRWSAPA